MSKYQWSDFIQKWKLEELTTEQAVGQLLLWTEETVNKVHSLQSTVWSLKREQAALVTQMEALSAKVRASSGSQLEYDALKREQAKVDGRLDRVAERVEGLVVRETRRHGGRS